MPSTMHYNLGGTVTDLLVLRRASRASKVSSLDAERLPSPLCGEPVFPLSCSADTLGWPMKFEQPGPGTALHQICDVRLSSP